MVAVDIDVIVVDAVDVVVMDASASTGSWMWPLHLWWVQVQAQVPGSTSRGSHEAAATTGSLDKDNEGSESN